MDEISLNQSDTTGQKPFKQFCEATSLHGWKFLTSDGTFRRPILKACWIVVVALSFGVACFFLFHSIKNFVSATVMTTQDTSRASLQNVFFPSVTLCNINQGRSSLFHEYGLADNKTLLQAVLGQAYFGSQKELSEDMIEEVATIFAAEEIIRKGELAEYMFQNSAFRQDALNMESIKDKTEDWKKTRNEKYIREAGWHFKTLAVQEVGENVVLRASYTLDGARRVKDIEKYTSLLPFFGTDYGLCTLIKPQITFDKDLEEIPFNELMRNYTKSIKPGIQLGKENGLSILLDAEVYDYGFSPHRGEGFKLAIHHHMDQPIMALSDVDISPGFVTQLSVTPTLTVTTEDAKNRFTPDDRVCYFDEEFYFEFLPKELYRYGLSNCLFAATYEEIMTVCKCVPFFHTMGYNESLNITICSGTTLSCMNKILGDIGSHTHVKDKDGNSKQCYSPCTDQTNKMAVTTSVFPNMNTFSHGPEFCVLYRKLRSTCQSQKRATLVNRYHTICSEIEAKPEDYCPRNITNDFAELDNIDLSHLNSDFVVSKVVRNDNFTKIIYRYARENLALVNVYIKDPAVTQIKRDQKVPLIWFVANVGGILGLTMGMSLVTIFEVIHHIAILFIRTGAKTIGAVQRGLTVSHAGIAKSPMVALRKNNINLPEEVESARSIELNIDFADRVRSCTKSNGSVTGAPESGNSFGLVGPQKATPERNSNKKNCQNIEFRLKNQSLHA